MTTPGLLPGPVIKKINKKRYSLILTLEPPGVTVYLKLPVCENYPVLQCTDFQGQTSLVIMKHRKYYEIKVVVI